MAPEGNTAQEEEALELPERYHSPGCPMDDDRLEWYETNQVTPTPTIPAGTRIEIIRCPDCGGQLTKAVKE